MLVGRREECRQLVNEVLPLDTPSEILESSRNLARERYGALLT